MRTKRKSFEDNESYFKFYNKMKDKIEVIKITVSKKIYIQYKKKVGTV